MRSTGPGGGDAPSPRSGTMRGMAMESRVCNQASGLRPEAEFAAHLREVQSRLYGYIHSLARDLNDADDLFQQTALIMWKKFDGYDRGRSFFSWACGIA